MQGKVVQGMISRGMVNCLSIPQRKPGAGRAVVQRRSPDLSKQVTVEDYPHLPKIYDVTDQLEKEKAAVYCGFDPTASCLHVGHLTVISPLFHFLKNGHQITALVGGATGRLGDPSGKKEARESVKAESIEENAIQIHSLLTTIFKNFHTRHRLGEESTFRVLNNVDWYKGMTVTDYMTEIASYFKLNNMFSRSIVENRLKDNSQNMEIREFVYQTFQCYDWYHLHKHYNCSIQIGGHDQLGNIEDGYSYIWNRSQPSPTLAGLTVPLVLSKRGEKLGKSAGNAFWLNAPKEKLADYFQTFRKDILRNLICRVSMLDNMELEDLSTNNLVDLLVEEISMLVR